jgi:phytoene dehydrogenase-like protein
MAGLVEPIADAVRILGGKVLLKREATRILFRAGRPSAVETKQGETYRADIVVANLPPPNAARLLSAEVPALASSVSARPADGWGAFVIYVGLDDSAIARDLPLHHQVVRGRPLGEGRSVFVSLSMPDDPTRAPVGQRAATLSTNTRLEPWWDLLSRDGAGLKALEADYTERLLAAADQAIPGFRSAARLVLPGSPIDFERFTHRVGGWVGGFPQTSLFRSARPRLGIGFWLVGDSIFPGQSTPAVALGGLRVADQILRQEVRPR